METTPLIIYGFNEGNTTHILSKKFVESFDLKIYTNKLIDGLPQEAIYGIPFTHINAVKQSDDTFFIDYAFNSGSGEFLYNLLAPELDADVSGKVKLGMYPVIDATDLDWSNHIEYTPDEMDQE